MGRRFTICRHFLICLVTFTPPPFPPFHLPNAQFKFTMRQNRGNGEKGARGNGGKGDPTTIRDYFSTGMCEEHDDVSCEDEPIHASEALVAVPVDATEALVDVPADATSQAYLLVIRKGVCSIDFGACKFECAKIDAAHGPFHGSGTYGYVTLHL